MQATTITEVIRILEEIIERAKKDKSTMGYFAALYHKVTVRVKEGIEKHEFQDNGRMEILDVIFANRYLEAYAQFQKKEKASSCWEYAFEQNKKYWPIVLQHLLLGINAHINLDLGIAAEQTCPGNKINELQSDFNKINEILSELATNVENDLSKIWPTLKTILRLTGKADDFFIDFSMELARNGAWKFATELAAMKPEEKNAAIKERDVKITGIAALVTKQGIVAGSIFKIIRLGEKGTIPNKINWLSL